MKSGEAVIDNSGWLEKTLPPAIVGVVVFLFTRVYDAWQFEKKLTEVEKKMAEAIKLQLVDFKENNVTPLRERVSKFDRTVETLKDDVAEVKLLIARIAEKLEVKAK